MRSNDMYKEQTATKVLEAEANAILSLIPNFPDQFEPAVSLLANVQGKIVCSGVGKSGIVAKKLCATLCSFGLPSVVLSAGDALHGDSGVLARGDALVIISYSGTSSDLEFLAKFARERDIPVVGIYGSLLGPLASISSLIVHVQVKETACPFSLAPMATTTATIAILDALVVAIVAEKKITPDVFAAYHPSGQLGRKLYYTVKEFMFPAAKAPKVKISATISQALLEMCRREIGAVCIVGDDDMLVGFITDGDVRRALLKGMPLDRDVGDIMNAAPKCLHPSTSVKDAIALMESGPDRFYVAPVINDNGSLEGLVRLHELIG